MTKFTFNHSGQVDKHTANAMDRLNTVEAVDENAALYAAAKSIWEEAGWKCFSDCSAHVFENFCANEI